MTSTSSKETGLRLKAAAESAIRSIGSGYDVTQDLRLKYCKQGERLIAVDDDQVRDVVIPGTGGILVQNVPKPINCDKGERMRFSSDVLSFQQMSEQFNHEVSLSGKIPTGHFNAAFELTGSWQKDASETKAFALDGVLITLYSIALEKSHISLCDHVKKAVPSSWDPAALARFIEKFGTHIIVGVKMGGMDVVYVKQQHTSVWQPDEVQKKLKDVADKRFSSRSGQYNSSPKEVHAREPLERTDYGQISVDSSREDITLFWRRRGGSSRSIDHHTWCQTVQLEPDVISMSFIPILSLLSGLDGSGFLTHAINLYLRYKPPIEELHQFLEFQLPKQWAPVFGELAVGPEAKPQNGASLQFSFMGPRLYVNTNMVDVDNRPVTGLRLYLEGKRNNCLAIHLQHLSSMPKSFRLEVEPNTNSGKSYDRRYYEKIQWKSFSHICTVPVESDDDLSIVTGAEFEVRDSGLKRVLFLKFHFAKVTGATVVRQPEWDGSPVLLTQKSGIISTLISARLSTGQKQPPPRPAEVILNSAIYPGGPPVSAHAPKLLKFVDTSEMTRGPQDLPGYWVVSGGRLMAEKGKISLRVKYSLLTVIPPEEEEEEEEEEVALE